MRNGMDVMGLGNVLLHCVGSATEWVGDSTTQCRQKKTSDNLISDIYTGSCPLCYDYRMSPRQGKCTVANNGE